MGSYDINEVVIIGRLTRDPETAYTKSNKQVTKFSIAVNKGTDKVNFFDVVAWDKLAGTCAQYLKKGSQCAIKGSLDQNRWTDDAGKNRSKISINAFTVQFIGGNGQQQGQAPQMTGQPQQQQANYQQPQQNAGYSQPQGNYQPPTQAPQMTGPATPQQQQNAQQNYNTAENIDFDNISPDPNDEVPF